MKQKPKTRSEAQDRLIKEIVTVFSKFREAVPIIICGKKQRPLIKPFTDRVSK